MAHSGHKRKTTKNHFCGILLGDIKNIIYDLLLADCEPIHIHTTAKHANSVRRDTLQDLKWRIIPARWNKKLVTNLLLVDKKTYLEAAPLLYRNHFTFSDAKALLIFLG